MERLTKRKEENGQRWIELRCCADCSERCDCEDIWMALDRLAAYEDTGLTPAEVADIAKAKADGRCVVLPCKVGDTVYFLIPGLEMGEGGFNLSGLFISEPHRITEVGTRGFWTSGLPRDEPDGMHDFTPWGDLGKTAFLTREEAEAALRKEQEK